MEKILMDKLGLARSLTEYFEEDKRYITVGVVVSASLGSYLLVQQIGAWKRRAEKARKREERRNEGERSVQAMKEKCKDVKKSEVDAILAMSLQELREDIVSSKLKPLQVLRAYQAKALEAHEKTNCVIEFVKEAEQWALDCESIDPTRRPLHGIPISIKEDLPIKGYDTAIGVASRVHQPCPDDSVVLKLMKKSGAIPFVRTNVPQLCLSYEGSNPIHGVTRNPHDPSRASGGSSSGEGAIIGYGASMLGIGSDIGGSIRNPCHFSGVAGFKPTTTRMSTRGANCYCGDNYFHNYVAPTWGPMGKDVDTILSALRILLDGPNMNALDQTIAPVMFNEQVLTEKRLLKIGYYEDNGTLCPVPAVSRALKQAKDYLQRQGHTLVPFKIPDMDYCMDLMFECFLADTGDQINEYLKDDIVDPCLASFCDITIPKYLRGFLAFVSQRSNPDRAYLLRILNKGGLLNYWDVASRIKAYRQQVSDEWRKVGLDALICPPFAFPATPFGCAAENFDSESYMMAYNVLNYPAGIVPMTRVNEKDVQEMAQYPTKDAKHRRIKELMEQKSTVGLPVGVQVVAFSYNDEMALNVMKQCEKASNYKI